MILKVFDNILRAGTRRTYRGRTGLSATHCHGFVWPISGWALGFPLCCWWHLLHFVTTGPDTLRAGETARALYRWMSHLQWDCCRDIALSGLIQHFPSRIQISLGTCKDTVLTGRYWDLWVWVPCVVGDSTAEWDIPGSKVQHTIVPAAPLPISSNKLEFSLACSEICLFILWPLYA